MFRPIVCDQKYWMDYNVAFQILDTDLSLLSYASSSKFVYEVLEYDSHIILILVLPAFLGYLWIFGLLFAVHQGDIEEKGKESSYKWTGEKSILIY